ncbi:MAG: NAD+ synthase [Deltaproteobacteria bacterium]|nr:NAD+ synthase [Deltaproteobacteria bacterium]
MKIALAQLNPVVGDIEGNVALIEKTVAAHAKSADLVAFSELFVSGYPPRDLLERPAFVAAAQAALDRLIVFSRGFPKTGILFGMPLLTGKAVGRGLYNAAVLLCGGEIVGIQAKTLLPNYDVFDEVRYFDPAAEVKPIVFGGETPGISICEDAWNDPEMWPRRKLYSFDPVAELRRRGATVMLNISASPFEAGKEELRFRLARAHARRHGVPFIYLNQVGANDELIFDGGSVVIDASGEPAAVLPTFREEIRVVDTTDRGSGELNATADMIESVHDALVLGVRDYCRKTGFSSAVVGLSGGIDSAVVCCLAAEALGAEHVLGVSMPSPYSSRGSVEDSRALAGNLGVEFRVVPITSVFDAYVGALKDQFGGRPPDVTEENIQARIRGNYLMAISNKLGHLVLSTGNKSEMAVGYCTLYGDMSGGLSVISDVPKTMVYKLAAHINRGGEVIPRAIIEKPPSAELRPNQTDQDTLPPYDILDRILHHYVEEGLSADEIAGHEFKPETVQWVIRTVNRSEYKRRQAAPGLRVTSKAFGVGRRMPIAARY